MNAVLFHGACLTFFPFRVYMPSARISPERFRNVRRPGGAGARTLCHAVGIGLLPIDFVFVSSAQVYTHRLHPNVRAGSAFCVSFGDRRYQYVRLVS